jgi:hypothetical protein
VALSPGTNLNWTAVSWGAPDQRRTDSCSYCGKPLSEDEIPLILWNDDGWCAEFCEACQRTHWGMEFE